jgi:hypothetical protein
MAAFEEHVLVWLRRLPRDADHVLAVTSHGSDWEGSTEGGFYSRFVVEIEYVTSAGHRSREYVEGDDMDSLWKHVVSAVDSA